MEKRWRDKLRIFLILYYFSENYTNSENPEWVRLLKGEVKVQKIDFLMRYPSYLCFELINLLNKNPNINRDEIKLIVKEIFESKEPEIRRIDMQRYFFGAWESLVDIIAFLDSHGLIKFESRLGIDGKIIDKEYFITKFGVEKIEKGLKEFPSLEWYNNRCQLIEKYFGDLNGNELKVMQYSHPEYANTNIRNYIADIEEKTRQLFMSKFSESI